MGNTLATRLHGVYLITDQGENLVARVRQAIHRVCAVQFRSKEHTPEERLDLGRELALACREAGVLFIVNDDIELALELDADGVHLGQEDGNPAEARQRLGARRLVGISTHTLEEALAAEAAGADYLGFGAMYPTGSKEITHLPGPELLAAVRTRITIPLVAIGGITRDNAPVVIDAGADCLAVISGIMGHPTPGLAAAELATLFNRRRPAPRGCVLTVAGSDSGGGAGIQADLKTITLLGAYGASVITALTAQNTLGVQGIQASTPEFVSLQLESVLSDLPVDVVKTGMLFSAGIITALADRIASRRLELVVVDPVMIATGGASLIDDSAVAAFREELLPRTYLLTPNVPEAEALTGIRIANDASMAQAARELCRMGARNVLIKGGHLEGAESVDLLFDGSSLRRFVSRRLASANTHGTGCTLASAIAAFLANGEPLPVAISRAKEFVTAAIRLSHPLGAGHGPVNHFLAAAELH
jgi:hydroxymethylpyrimidine kinase/phosphomethylpyrimidine kinase/thiamine-phosphate diphosphorylase